MSEELPALGWARLDALRAAEDERLAARLPRSRTLWERAQRSQPCGVPMAWMAGLYRHPPIFAVKGQGAWFEDADGHRYLDMNQADLAATLGFAPPPIVEALTQRLAEGSAFLLPTDDGIQACEELARRSGLPFWQFTGSASAANAEAFRLARVATGRDQILMFHGKYHGHLDESLGGDEGDFLGLPRTAGRDIRQIAFNDLAALERALAAKQIAALIAEPLLTNCNLVFPDPGFWESARRLCQEAGTLLIIDEAHSHSFAFGGLTRAWDLQPDIQVLGKGLGSGIAFGCYGMTESLGQLMAEKLDVDIGPPGLATGGTTYANPLALTAAQVSLQQCLREEDYARAEALGQRLAEGLQGLFDRRGLGWRAPQIGGRSGWVLFPDLPRNADQSLRSLDPRFVDTRRHFMASRDIWEAVGSAGPACSFAHREADVDRYLEISEGFLRAVFD
ncbi:MAG: aminotransferase class III-fold pyridoxal phosphate-dependent enzyme [Pseudomonadota bacterium]